MNRTFLFFVQIHARTLEGAGEQQHRTRNLKVRKQQSEIFTETRSKEFKFFFLQAPGSFTVFLITATVSTVEFSPIQVLTVVS